MHDTTMNSGYLMCRATTIMRYVTKSTMCNYRAYNKVKIAAYRCTTVLQSSSGTRRYTHVEYSNA